MKQSFDVKGGPEFGRRHLPLLRQALSTQNLDGFYIPHEDEYQNEYVPDAYDRLAWVSGFTGSAGSAIVWQDEAVLFADGRYTLQAEDQTAAELFTCVAVPDPGPFGWLAMQMRAGQTLGYDPKLMTPNSVDRLQTAACKAGVTLVSVTENPIDQAWTDQPAPPALPVIPHAIEIAGEPSDTKRGKIAEQLKARDEDAVVITSPASLAWLFNIRGSDVAHTPLPLGRAVLFSNGTADLYLDLTKHTDALNEHLGEDVTLRDLAALDAGLADLKGKTISLDPDLASAWFFQTLEAAGAVISPGPDPILLPKACKNSSELAGTVAAHRRDGVALTEFLHWLDTEAQSGNATEIDAALKLESFRDGVSDLQDLSFETISGAGPNGALPHYRVSTASNRTLERGTLYLVDSGGQYPDGTTDVTRTVAIGTPSADMIRDYTLVLKGHIALAQIRFPNGTTGTHLDALARAPLWQAGMDFDHGTGHGVGVYLGVHEGPQRISKGWNNIALQPGMIVSNEPGLYKEGAYGIRIENLQFVTQPTHIDGGNRKMLGFECLTFAPLARTLIASDLLTATERAWVDAYHARVLDIIGPALTSEVKSWTEAACAPL